MVKTFYAPKEVCPPSQRESKRPAAESQNVKQQHTSSGVCFDFQKGECRRGSKCKFTHDGPDNTLGPSRSRREEVSTLMGEVKGLSSTTLIGMAKKKNKEDVLTKLGVRAVKNQTMPLKMALGIRDGRLKRQDKIVKVRDKIRSGLFRIERECGSLESVKSHYNERSFFCGKSPVLDYRIRIYSIKRIPSRWQ